MPPKEEMDFRVYRTQLANSIYATSLSHPLFNSLLSTPDFQSTCNECTAAHENQDITDNKIGILQNSIGGIPYFRLISTFLFLFILIYKFISAHLLSL